jgi:hypothetical protein
MREVVRHLRIYRWAAASERWLRVARRTAIAVEPRTEAGAVCDGSGNGIDLLKSQESLRKEGEICYVACRVGVVENREGSSRAGWAAAWTGVGRFAV